MSDYFSKPFKSPIIRHNKDIGMPHFTKKTATNTNLINTHIYKDGLITTIDPKTGFLSISIDSGNTWISAILKTSIKNIKRVGKETFVFEINNGANPTIFAVTFDMFCSYIVIPVGTDNNTMRMKCKNQISNKPICFIRNSLYSFNEELKIYNKIDTFTTEYCSLHDSIDGVSTYLIIPSSIGYSVRKYGDPDRNIVTYINHYTYTTGSFIGSLLSFNVLKTVSDVECFVISTTDFYIQIDIPSNNVFSNSSTRKIIQFKDSTITTTNCNSGSILVSSINNRLYIFTNATYKHSCSIYIIDNDGNFIRENDVFFNNSMIIKDKNNVLYDNSLSNTALSYVSNIDNKFLISVLYKTILFDVTTFNSVDYITDRYGVRDIYGNNIGNIFVSDDIVSFNGKFNNIIGSNVTTNPINGFSKYIDGNFSSIIKDTQIPNTASTLKGLPVGGSFYVKDGSKLSTFTYNADNSSTIVYTSTINLLNTYIIDACFHDDDLFYVKINSTEVVSNSNYHKINYPILCSFKRGELISFQYIVSSRDKFLIGEHTPYEYVRFKSIKVVNGKLVVLFYNTNPYFIDENYKNYDNSSYKYGMITSLDYTGELYVIGVSEPVQKVGTESDVWSHGNSIYIGKSIKHLTLFDRCTVLDIKMDKYRDLIYISTLYDFRVYDKYMNLIVKYDVNLINNPTYEYLNISKRFLLHSDYRDINRVLSNSSVYNRSDIISFNDSVDSGKDINISVSSINNNDLSTNSAKNMIIDRNIDIVTENGNNKPLFTNNLIGKRDNNSFSIYSKSETTGIVTEFSFNNRLIVTYPTSKSKHDSKCIIIESNATVVSNTVTYSHISLKVVKNYVILRVNSLLKVYKVNIYDGLITQEYFTTLPAATYPELGSAVINKDKLIIPYGNSTILELSITSTTSFIRYAQCKLSTDEIVNLHQIEDFNGILLCTYSIGSAIGKVGTVILSNNEYIIVPLNIINTYSVETPLLKIYSDYIEVVHCNNIVLKYDINDIYYDEYNDFYRNEIYSSDSTTPISIDNTSIRDSLNRNFTLLTKQTVDTYEILAKKNIGLIKDFDSGLIFNIIKHIGGNFIISDTFTDRKRIDVSVSMGDSNVVKRIKTDKYDVFIDDTIYPKISAYIKDISETEMNMLCTLILSETAL